MDSYFSCSREYLELYQSGALPPNRNFPKVLHTEGIEARELVIDVIELLRSHILAGKESNPKPAREGRVTTALKPGHLAGSGAWYRLSSGS